MSSSSKNNKKSLEYEVKSIIDDRKRRKLNKVTGKFEFYYEYLIKWKYFYKPTWEPEQNLSNCQDILNKYLIEKDKNEKKNKAMSSCKIPIRRKKNKTFGSPIKEKKIRKKNKSKSKSIIFKDESKSITPIKNKNSNANKTTIKPNKISEGEESTNKNSDKVPKKIPNFLNKKRNKIIEDNESEYEDDNYEIEILENNEKIKELNKNKAININLSCNKFENKFDWINKNFDNNNKINNIQINENVVGDNKYCFKENKSKEVKNNYKKELNNNEKTSEKFLKISQIEIQNKMEDQIIFEYFTEVNKKIIKKRDCSKNAIIPKDLIIKYYEFFLKKNNPGYIMRFNILDEQ